MEHEVIEALIPAYAAGAADPAEIAQIERHLPGCVPCRALLTEYQNLCAGLLYAVPQVAAPAKLRGDLVRRLGQDSRSRVPAGQKTVRPGAIRWPVLAFTAAVVLLVATNLYWLNRIGLVERDMTRQATVVAMLAEHPREVGLSGEAAVPNAGGDFYFNPQGNTGVLKVFGLPPAPAGKAYQLWLIRSGQRDSGGLFGVNPDGAGMLVVSTGRALQQYDGLGVTLEPEEGSPAPTTPRLLAGRF